MNKNLSFLLALIIITATIAPFIAKATGAELNPIYNGPAPSNDDVIASHGITFSIDNGSVLYSDSGNLTLGFYAYQDTSENMQTLSAELYSVSYKASWLDQPVTVYQWSIHDPANLHDDDPNPQQSFRYTIDLTNVPKGQQHIEVTATGGGYIWGINPQTSQAYYQTFSKTSSASLNFTIETSPPITPSPTFSPESGILWETNVPWNLTGTPAQNLWQTDIQGESRTWTSPAVVDGVAYAGSTSTVTLNQYGLPTIDWIDVYAFNASNGAEIWQYKCPPSDQMTNLAVVNGIVYFGATDFNNNQYVYALDDSNGKLLWNASCNTFTSSPAVTQGMVFIGSGDSIIALDATKGNILWNFTTGDVVLSSPTVVNGIVYIGSNDANLYALKAETGEKIWSYTAGEGFFCTASVANGVVYASSDDGNIYALNAATGAKIWNYDTTPSGYAWQKRIGSLANPTSTVVADGRVYFLSSFIPFDPNIPPTETAQTTGNGWTMVYALDAANGNKIWNTTIGTAGSSGSSPIIFNGIVYTKTDLGILGLSTNNGAVIWNSSSIELSSASEPVVVNGVLYIGSGDGQVYAIKTPSGPLDSATATSFSTTTVAIAAVAVIVAAGLRVYFKKHKR